MDMIDRYLNAVAAQLPADERADIIAELRDLILSRFEAREAELGRALTADEQEEILHEIGHPLVVAARYRKGPDSLVGPELFPYWLFGVKAGLMILLAVQAISLVLHVISGPADAGQAIAQAFHGFFGSALSLVGVATVIAAVFEHYGVRPTWLTRWRVKDLGAFGLSDPATWSGSMTGKPAAKASWMPGRSRKAAKGWPGGDYLFSVLVTGMFVLWWVGLLNFPGLGSIGLRGEDARLSGAPVWAALHGPILIYALAQMAADLVGVVRPHAVRLVALVQIPVAVGGLWLAHQIFQAGHWFTLTRGTESVRIEGYVPILWDRDGLAWLGTHGRALNDVAQDLAMVTSWVLAFIVLGLLWQILSRVWRLVRG